MPEVLTKAERAAKYQMSANSVRTAMEEAFLISVASAAPEVFGTFEAKNYLTGLRQFYLEKLLNRTWVRPKTLRRKMGRPTSW